MINIVIPMAGLGSRFLSAGYKKSKPFIDFVKVKGGSYLKEILLLNSV